MHLGVIWRGKEGEIESVCLFNQSVLFEEAHFLLYGLFTEKRFSDLKWTIIVVQRQMGQFVAGKTPPLLLVVATDRRLYQPQE